MDEVAVSMVARRVPARAKKQPGLRVGTKITSGQKAQFKHYEKNRVRQKNEGRKMKVARFAQRKGGGVSYISAKDFSDILFKFKRTRISFCADPNQGPPELPRKAANVKCLTTSPMPLLESQSDRSHREKCFRCDPHD
jgi:hypothetical protein